MNFQPQIVKNGCNFKFLRWIASDVYKLKPVKFITVLILIFHSAFSMGQVYHMFCVFSFRQTVQYGTIFCGMNYPIFAMSVLLAKNKVVEEIMSNFSVWSTATVGKEAEIKIKRESKMITYFILINTIIAVIACLAFLRKLDDDPDLFFAMYLFRSHFPDNYLFLDLLYKITFLPITFVMMAHCYQVIYTTHEIRIQLFMLNEATRNITKDYEEFEDNFLVHNKEYQIRITKRLKILVKKHIHMQIGATKGLEIMAHMIVPFTLIACLLGSSIVSFFYFYEGDFKDHYPRLFSLGLAGFLAFLAIVKSGQAVEDESTALLSILMQSKWWTWNKENKQVLMIFAENSIKPIKIKFTENIAINYALGVAVVKVVYSMISVFSSVRNKL